MTVTEPPGDTHGAARPDTDRPHATRCGCASATATPSRSTSTRSSAPSSAAADGLADVDPLRVATKTISGLYDGATTARARPAVDPDRGRADRRGAAVLAARRPPARRVHRQGGPQPGHRTRSASRSRLGHARGPDRRRDRRRSSRRNARKLDDAIDAGDDRRFEYFGLRTVYDRYLLRHPHDPRWSSRRRSTSACASPAGSSQYAGRGDRVLPADVVARVPAQLADAVQLRHAAHRSCRRCFLLDSPADELDSIYDALHARRAAVEVRRRHRHRVLTASARAAR